MSARSALVRQLRCIACEMEDSLSPDEQCGRSEEHHCNKFELAGHERIGDHASVCLGAWHHRGAPLPGMTLDQMAFKYGPSLALNKKLFRLTYGSDENLIALTNHKLAQLLPATA